MPFRATTQGMSCA